MSESWRGDVSLLGEGYCFVVSVPMLKDLERRVLSCSGRLACKEKKQVRGICGIMQGQASVRSKRVSRKTEVTAQIKKKKERDTEQNLGSCFQCARVSLGEKEVAASCMGEAKARAYCAGRTEGCDAPARERHAAQRPLKTLCGSWSEKAGRGTGLQIYIRTEGTFNMQIRSEFCFTRCNDISQMLPEY